MKLTLREQLTQFQHILQACLFPVLEQQIGNLDERGKQLIATLELIPLARFIPVCHGWMGRPSKDRLAIARAFVAKAVYGLGTTRQLLQQLSQDAQLRQICGWDEPHRPPHEATFSRAFGEFAQMELPQLVHEALIRSTQQDRLIGHIARDSTAIHARERFPETRQQRARAAHPVPREKRPRKKPVHRKWKGGQRVTAPCPDTRLHKQRNMPLDAMLRELPRACSIGTKVNTQGRQQHWRGYKLHLDVADGQIPVSAVLTAAHVHDSQVAIPLATLSSQRVTYLYELMDSAYDAVEIREHVACMGHVAIVDPAARGRRTKSEIGLGKQPRQLSWAQRERYKERTMAERVYARLKDEFGARQVRVRGAAKVMTHLMFGVLALTADQLLRLVR